MTRSPVSKVSLTLPPASTSHVRPDGKRITVASPWPTSRNVISSHDSAGQLARCHRAAAGHVHGAGALWSTPPVTIHARHTTATAAHPAIVMCLTRPRPPSARAMAGGDRPSPSSADRRSRPFVRAIAMNAPDERAVVRGRAPPARAAAPRGRATARSTTMSALCSSARTPERRRHGEGVAERWPERCRRHEREARHLDDAHRRHRQQIGEQPRGRRHVEPPRGDRQQHRLHRQRRRDQHGHGAHAAANPPTRSRRRARLRAASTPTRAPRACRPRRTTGRSRRRATPVDRRATAAPLPRRGPGAQRRECPTSAPRRSHRRP